MKILLLQISDIHFKKEGNLVVERVDAIKNAVQGIDSSFDACFVVMTGDIAYGGQATEYEVAHDFFNALKVALSSINQGSLRVEEVFIPGNHDCALKPKNEIRSLVLSTIMENVQTPFRPSDAYIDLCLQPQEEFWKFYERRLGTPAPSIGSERLFQTHDFKLGGKTLRFECYNTAWMSQVPDQQGQLLVPTNLAGEASSDKADAVVSLLHHPLNWLDPVNSKALRRDIEKRSDIVLTGHEHVGDQFTKKSASGTINEYLEGAVLQETGADNSGFYAMLLNLETRQRRIRLYSWQSDHYAPDGVAEWVSFERTRALSAARFENTDAFNVVLRDVGAPFKHPDPAKTELYLDDIFVYPDFDQRTYLHNSMKVSKVNGDETIDFILRQNQILFFGNDRCGKSAFARKIYRDLQDYDKVPLLLDGAKLKSPEEGAMKTILDRAIREQYGTEMVEKFRQLDPQRKVLLVDNFHASNLNLKAQNLAVERFNLQFGKVILFGAETVRYQELDHSNGEYSVLLSFQQCELHAFGKRARGELIEKWCSLGNDLLDNEREVANKVREAENLVSVLMRKNLLPAYPIFILIILQQFETHSNLDTASGSYGYYYDVLITTALHNQSKKIPIDMLYPFLSRVAYRMFEGRKSSLSREAWEDVARAYQQEHKVTFSSQEMMRIVQEARMLHQDSEGYYSFQYKYIGYFFVARYFKDNVYKQAHQQTLRRQLQSLVNRIYIEDDANILMFFLYMTKDERTIEELVAKTRTLFSEVEPCDFETHVTFINHNKNSMILELESGSTGEHRDTHRKSQDEADDLDIPDEEAELANDPGSMDEEEEDATENPESREFAVAMRTLEVMGQVLCNFPGTLDGQTKLDIAQECYLVGLRFVRAFLQMMEDNEQGFRSVLADGLQGPHEEDFDDQGTYVAKRLSESELDEKTNALFYGFLMFSAWGLVKRISHCIGSRHLSQTYKEVTDAKVPISIELVTTAIKLDHFQDFPTDEVLALHKKLKGNNFTETILRCIVREHFHLYPSDPQTRHKVCDKLRIKREPKALLAGSKTRFH